VVGAATAADVPLSMSADYTFASAGFVPVGLNFVSRKSTEAGVSSCPWFNSEAFVTQQPDSIESC